jgi:hypothetical protein
LDEFAVDRTVAATRDARAARFAARSTRSRARASTPATTAAGRDARESRSADGVGAARRRRASARERGIDDDARRTSVEM